jgi:hypothetical protein
LARTSLAKRTSGAAQLLAGAHQQHVGNRQDVGTALAQRGHAQGDASDAVVQVFAEAARAHVLLQVAVGGGNHPHIDQYRAAGAHGAHLALLQHAQQLDLEGR